MRFLITAQKVAITYTITFFAIGGAPMLFWVWNRQGNETNFGSTRKPLQQQIVTTTTKWVWAGGFVTAFVTEFWKITLIGVPETIRIFEFTTILLTSQKHILNIFTLFLVIQCIFIVLEP